MNNVYLLHFKIWSATALASLWKSFGWWLSVMNSNLLSETSVKKRNTKAALEPQHSKFIVSIEPTSRLPGAKPLWSCC